MSEVAQDGKTDTGEATIVPTEGKSEAEIGGQSAPEKNSDDDLPAGIKKRFATLTRQKHEERNKYESLRNEFESLKSSLAQPKQYESKEEAVADLVAKEIERREQIARVEKEKSEKSLKYAEKYNASDVSDIEDFDDTLENCPIDFNDPVDKDIADYILQSDSGKRLAYELAKSPELFDTLRQMSYSVRAKTLIKLDEQLYSGISQKKAEAVVDKTIEDAAETSTQKKIVPKLITPVTGKTVPKGKGTQTMEEYIEERNQRLAKKR